MVLSRVDVELLRQHEALKAKGLKRLEPRGLVREVRQHEALKAKGLRLVQPLHQIIHCCQHEALKAKGLKRHDFLHGVICYGQHEALKTKGLKHQVEAVAGDLEMSPRGPEGKGIETTSPVSSSAPFPLRMKP